MHANLHLKAYLFVSCYKKVKHDIKKNKIVNNVHKLILINLTINFKLFIT